MTGTKFNDSLQSAGGLDTLDGGAGTDTLAGGTGDDWYTVDRSTDIIVEFAGGGLDLVRSNHQATRWALRSRL